MIFCVTKRPDEYVINHNGVLSGLYASYGYDDDLFNIVSRTSIAMFMYEPQFDDMHLGDIVTSLNDIDDMVKLLDYSIQGMTVKEAINRYNPVEFVDRVQGQGFSQDLTSSMYLRSLQFKKYYKGVMGYKENGVSIVKFGPSITNFEDDLLEKTVKGIKEKYVKAKNVKGY